VACLLEAIIEWGYSIREIIWRFLQLCAYCPSKDDKVVEYSLSRSLSPALIAAYQTGLPDKKLLQTKLYEFYEQLPSETDTP
jgi:hypothetical protein